MPQEIRYLLFSNEELYQALSAGSRAHGRPLPRGFLKSVVLGEATTIDVTLICVTDDGVEVPICFQQHHIISALIAYCGQRKIPMSAKAAKTLEIKNGQIALLCALGLKLPVPAANRRIQASIRRP
jgi:hypothetical protein